MNTTPEMLQFNVDDRVSYYENIPSFAAQALTLLFGCPLNIFLAVRLAHQGKNNILPKFAYPLIIRHLFDAFVGFFNTWSDLNWLGILTTTAVTDYMAYVVYISLDTLACVCDLLTIANWQITINSTTDVDKAILVFIPILTIITLLITTATTYVPLFIPGTEYWNSTIYNYNNLVRIIIFTAIFMTYYLEVRRVRSSFYSSFTVEFNKRFMKYFKIETTIRTFHCLVIVTRSVIYYALMGRLTIDVPGPLVTVIFYQLDWSLACLLPLVRAIVIAWIFPNLLRQSNMVKNSSNSTETWNETAQAQQRAKSVCVT